MADFVKNLFGAASSAVSSAIPSDSDFADFATAVSPSAPSHAASSVFNEATATASAASLSSFFSNANPYAGRPYTKWYRVWERTTIADFYQELVIIPIILVIVLIHIWGTRANRGQAKRWASTYLPMLESEFAVVGFGGQKKSPKVDDDQSDGLAKAIAGSTDVPSDLLREQSKNTYITYCTGRQNVAFLDIRLILYKRYNPFLWFGEAALSFVFDTILPPTERLEAIAYCFDGKEKQIVPQSGQSTPGNRDSSYDGFVWAIVHKDKMRQLRDDRYDLSLTTTKDHPKLPEWTTVMTESAEVTEALLTPELIKAVNDAGDDFESLIVSDQPIDAPKKLDETIPKKRVALSVRLNPKPSSTSLFAAFLRLPDQLVSVGHFRPEAMRRIRQTREEEQRKIRKLTEDEKAEERRTQTDKVKKEERDRKLSRMSADEQKKFLQKEKDAEQRKNMKKRTTRG